MTMHATYASSLEIERLAWGSLEASLAYPQMQYVVDKFHARGHVDPWCKQNCHPEAAGNKELIQQINTSVCEITFARLSRFKQMTRKNEPVDLLVFRAGGRG